MRSAGRKKGGGRQDEASHCAHCGKRAVQINTSGSVEIGKTIIWWLSGECRECGRTTVKCQDCGTDIAVKQGKDVQCECGHMWKMGKKGVNVVPAVTAEGAGR